MLGYLMAGAGLGGVMSALTLAAESNAERKGRFIISNAALFSLELILFAEAHSFWWAFFLLVVPGVTMVGVLALTNTSLQIVSPPELRARIMSLYNLSTMGLTSLGSLQMGSVAEAMGTRFALTLGGTIPFINHDSGFIHNFGKLSFPACHDDGRQAVAEHVD